MWKKNCELWKIIENLIGYEMYETFYYFIILLSVCTYFVSLRIFRLRLITCSTLMYVLAFLFIMLPGYEIATGNAISPAFNHGFDNEIYF